MSSKIHVDEHGEMETSKQSKTYSVTELVNALRRITDFQFFFSMMGVAFMIAQLEIVWSLNTTGSFPLCRDGRDPEWCDPREQVKVFPLKEGQFLVNIIRGVITASTITALYYQNRYYHTHCELLKTRNLLPKNATFWRSPRLMWGYLVEFIIQAIHVFPGVDEVDQKDPNFLILANLLMFLRLWQFSRVLSYHSSFNTSNGRFIGTLTNVHFSTPFMFKTTLKDHAAKVIGLTSLCLLFVSSYCLHIIDSYICAVDMDMKCSPLSFLDSAWLVTITILTVGYGDIVPQTPGGRFITIMGSLIGTFITAITIAVTTSNMSLSRAEHKVVTFLKKDENRRLLQQKAAECIQASYRWYLAKQTGHIGIMSHAEIHVFSALRNFRSTKRYVLSHDGSDPTDRQITMLETMEVNMDDLKEKIDALELSLCLGASSENAEAIAVAKNEPKILQGEANGDPPKEEPEWARVLTQMLKRSSDKVAELQKDLARLSHTVTRHVDDANRRLAALEEKATGL